MKQLLDRGAFPDPRGFEVTPLQICCFTLDVRGIQLLLDAGADTNDVGQKGGYRWDTMMTCLATLHGLSPPHILKRSIRMEYKRYEQADGFHESVVKLKQHGARDFYVDGCGKLVPLDYISRVENFGR